MGRRERLDTMQALFSTTQSIDVFSPQLDIQMQNTAPYRLLCKKLTPSQLDPVQGNNPQPICFGTGATAVLCHAEVTSHYVNHFVIFMTSMLKN